MDNKSFWLIDISNSVLSVSLVNKADSAFIINAIGPPKPYIAEQDSIVSAVDASLSLAAKSADLVQDQEPNSAAFILSPSWIGSDGKIIPQNIKLIEHICRDLDFKPMGFIANDEAIVEDANHRDGFPTSFVLVNLSDNQMSVSLAYLGKVIERVSKTLDSTFNPSLLEEALIELKTESTLPPQIIIFGNVDKKIIDSIKDFPWIGKKNIETFLHFPDIISYNYSETIQIYTRAITSQFPLSDDALPTTQTPPKSQPEDNTPPPETPLTEVSPANLGFEKVTKEDTPSSDNLTIPTHIPPLVDETINSSPPSRPKFKIKLPRLPKFHLPFKKILIIPAVISPLLILIPFLFSKANITLYLTHYNFNKQINVTLDPNADTIDLTKNLIPVDRQSIDIGSSASLPVTGQTTIGNKASGEITIFNQKNNPQKLPSGTVLIDSQGNQFLTTSTVDVVPSTADLNLGVITLGQVKTIVTAAIIGPEYNLAKDTQLQFKDFPDTSLIAKVNNTFTGGSKSQVKAVSSADKTKLAEEMELLITKSINEKIDQLNQSSKGIISNSDQINKGRIDYSREIGEKADTLEATASSSIFVYSLNSDNKDKLIKASLAEEPHYNDSLINSNNFDLSISSVTLSADRIKGLLNIKGLAAPKVDPSAVIKMISGKKLSTAHALIQKQMPLVYNFEITTNFSYLQFINPLPFRASNINVVLK